MINEMEQSPATNGISTIDLWCIICLVMVAIASLEYAVLLYLMRFGKRSLVSFFSKNLFATCKVSTNQGKGGNSPMLNEENNVETNSLSLLQGKVIDYCALIFVPILFILVVIVYFLYYLCKG